MAQAKKDDSEDPVKIPDPLALTQALMQAYERAMPLMSDLMEHYGDNFSQQSIDPFNVRKSYSEFLSHLYGNPQKLVELQMGYWQDWTHLWQESARKFMGEDADTVIEPEPGDRRFRSPAWQDSALFDYIKQSYLLTCHWMHKAVEETQGLSEEDRKKVDFYTQLFANALSPTNFALTNPEVLQETLKTGGENLVRGLENLIEDFRRGNGELAISTTNYEAFTLGKNIATTKGQVVYQNELMQLIQYEPTTKTVFKKPLLIIPPWINKYYILDLRPDNSLIKWAISQGHTVFTISWVNPDSKLAKKRFEDYMDEGVLTALDQVQAITGEPDANVIGYCLGGTLLTITLAYLAAKKKEKQIASATLLTTLVDFEYAGNMKLFMGDEQLALMDREMAEKGVLEARQLQKTFSLLRANDLIWSFVINNYLMGKEPFPFDLLYWNDDSTNMPAAMHSMYLRKMYRDNLLPKPGGISMHKTPIDISTIKTPAYFLSTREDHIAPWRATYATTQLTSGPVTFTLAASGHIAGVVNSPEKNKYCYWSSNKTPKNPDQWLKQAEQYEGSWWPHWQKWVKQYAESKVAARKVKKGLEAAPGSYVKVKST